MSVEKRDIFYYYYFIFGLKSLVQGSEVTKKDKKLRNCKMSVPLKEFVKYVGKLF